MKPRASGAAPLLTLALVAAAAALASLGAGVFREQRTASPPASLCPAPGDGVEALLARVRSAEATPAECAARVPDLASAALDERDPRRGAAIAALGLAGTAESREALLRIVETGPLADAALAERALAGAVRAPEGF